jgi:hypothetical protein
MQDRLFCQRWERPRLEQFSRLCPGDGLGELIVQICTISVVQIKLGQYNYKFSKHTISVSIQFQSAYNFSQHTISSAYNFSQYTISAKYECAMLLVLC